MEQDTFVYVDGTPIPSWNSGDAPEKQHSQSYMHTQSCSTQCVRPPALTTVSFLIYSGMSVMGIMS